jgi:hypothetical protein
LASLLRSHWLHCSGLILALVKFFKTDENYVQPRDRHNRCSLTKSLKCRSFKKVFWDEAFPAFTLSDAGGGGGKRDAQRGMLVLVMRDGWKVRACVHVVGTGSSGCHKIYYFQIRSDEIALMISRLSANVLPYDLCHFKHTLNPFGHIQFRYNIPMKTQIFLTSNRRNSVFKIVFLVHYGLKEVTLISQIAARAAILEPV